MPNRPDYLACWLGITRVGGTVVLIKTRLVGRSLAHGIEVASADHIVLATKCADYASTEGSLFDFEGRPSAIGRIPPLLAHRFPAAIMKVDCADGRPARSWDGLCMPCGIGEVGHAMGRIGSIENGDVFEDYTDGAETKRKNLRDVFEGDAWFATGDLMRRAERGYFHFVDRVGDMFRWKGENVATGEVSDAIRDCAGVVGAATYGVAVPDCDRRAGMAAVVTKDGFDLAILAEHLGQRLPLYAIPVFLRLCALSTPPRLPSSRSSAWSAKDLNPRSRTVRCFAPSRRRPAPAARCGRSHPHCGRWNQVLVYRTRTESVF